MIPYGKHTIDKADLAAVTEVLQSPWLTQGPMVEAFEQALATHCQTQHCAVVSNGTAALHLACLALGLGEGDLLWTTPISFVASANCARYCGAEVDFVDIDPATGNLSLVALQHKLKLAAAAGRLPKVVVAVHFTGNPCDLKGISAALEPYGIALIEDACHAIGAEYDQRRVGSCQYSDITVFSFHPVKIITSGEGGALCTNDSALIHRIKLLRTHGTTKEPGLLQRPDEGGWYYEQQSLGFNYRMTDIQAALGLSQLQKIDGFIEARSAIAKRYDQELSALPCEILSVTREAKSSYHLYIIKVDANERRRLYEHLHSRGILVQVHYFPIHLQPYYQQLGFKEGDFPQAETFYRQVLSLPIYSSLSHEDQDSVVRTLREFWA